MAAKASKLTTQLEPSLQNFSITSTKPSESRETPDSWERDADSPISTPSSPSTPTQDSESVPCPPPPTPISPTLRRGKSRDWDSFTKTAAPRSSPRGAASQEKRPEKSNLVAGKMIAGALGVKGPMMTEEQRGYEIAVREKERKRLETEKEEGRRREKEKEDGKRAIWDD